MQIAPSRPEIEEVAVQVQWIDQAAPVQPVSPALDKIAKRIQRPVLRRPVRVVRRGIEQVKSSPAPAPPRPVPVSVTPPLPVPAVAIGVKLDSTVVDSAFIIPIGTTLEGEVPRVAPAAAAPAPARSGRIGNYVPFDQLSEPPVLLAEVRAAYPAGARTAGVTGEVILRVAIDAQGIVAEATRLSGPGHGLDEVALAAVKQFRFRPARYDGVPVGTVIRYIYSFHIE